MNSFSSVTDLGIKVLILTAVLALLPQSPFLSYVSLVNRIPFLNYFNWFIPVADILTVIEGWLAVVSIYYSILFGTRFVGIVKG